MTVKYLGRDEATVGDVVRFRAGYDAVRSGTVTQVTDDDELVVAYKRKAKDGTFVVRFGLIVRRDVYSVKRDVEDETVRMTKTEMARLLKRANEAGLAAERESRPTPMVVGTPKDMMASLRGEDYGGFDENQPTYFVEGGVCGYATVSVRPGTSRFARWLKQNGAIAGSLGSWSRGYYGGMEASVWTGGQSLERKEAYARAFVKVLVEAGIEASMDSRMD